MDHALTLSFWLRRIARRPPTPPQQTVELLAGQRLDIALAPRDGLCVVAGEVVLVRPAQWLGGALVARGGGRLGEGDGWTAVERERVTLVATRTSRVLRRAGS
ncbi:MAG: hypothetical protein JO224_03440 [Pelomonas sp.]|nr:hypothetical protein [Roseateles sp.]